MCKANSALTVKIKMSGVAGGLCCSPSFYLLLLEFLASNSALRTQKELDIGSYSNIIIFTDAYGQPTANQTIVPAPAGHAEPSPQRGPARELSRQRVLRSGRSTSGEVRDAAAGGRRQTTGQPGSKEFWLFAPVLLSSADSISGGWPRWASATQTRAAIWAQADQRVDAVCDTTPGDRAGDIESSTGGSDRAAFRHLGSPSQYRPSVAESKKTPVIPQPNTLSLADRRLVAAYEELRCQALQGWRRGPGLALLITRGFRCWMEGCSHLLVTECSSRPAPDQPSSMPSGLRRELVILLASMLLQRSSKGIA